MPLIRVSRSRIQQIQRCCGKVIRYLFDPDRAPGIRSSELVPSFVMPCTHIVPYFDIIQRTHLVQLGPFSFLSLAFARVLIAHQIFRQTRYDLVPAISR